MTAKVDTVCADCRGQLTEMERYTQGQAGFQQFQTGSEFTKTLLDLCLKGRAVE